VASVCTKVFSQGANACTCSAAASENSNPRVGACYDDAQKTVDCWYASESAWPHAVDLLSGAYMAFSCWHYCNTQSVVAFPSSPLEKTVRGCGTHCSAKQGIRSGLTLTGESASRIWSTLLSAFGGSSAHLGRMAPSNVQMCPIEVTTVCAGSPPHKAQYPKVHCLPDNE
jgi:hypothetical protein